MSHLSLETIARIVDDAASADEQAHLDQCRICTAELESMREDVHGLSMLPDMTPAPDAWGALERRLADEGLIRTRPRRAFTFMPMMQAAAAVLLFIGGSVAGRMTAPESAPHVVQAPSADETQPRAVAETPLPAPMQSAPAVMLAGNTLGRNTQPRSAEEAAALLREVEELYLNALTRYAELTSGAESGDPVARLAAMQSIVNTTQAALMAAPTDPVINGYHLTALAQRDATLRQVAAATGERWY